MGELFLAAAVFLGSHIGLSSTPLRDMLAGSLGERVFQVGYSLVSLAAIIWLVMAYNDAVYTPGGATLFWPISVIGTLIPVVLMLLACLFLVGGVSTPNPTAAAAAGFLDADDPARGVLRITRHPVMWAIGLWGLAHLGPNGDAASVLFFLTLTALALGGTLLIDAKFERRHGESYRRFQALTSNIPFAAIAGGRQKLAVTEIGPRRIGAAVILYLVLFGLHRAVIGVNAHGVLGG